MESDSNDLSTRCQTRVDLAYRIRSQLSEDMKTINSDDEPNWANSKQSIRHAHSRQRHQTMVKEKFALGKHLPRLIGNFATGRDVNPEKIDARLVPVNSRDDTGLLFRLAATLWSVPVSRGYGRRMRFLVEDHFNGKIIGILALGDPVIGMAARDRWIGWSVDEKNRRLTNVLDAYVCGAVPPYNQLLGGKLVVSLIGSKEVSQEFNRRYHDQPNNRGEYKHPRLAVVTVTSALGRSSLYNRVKLPGLVELERVGESTKGWGHFHISDELFGDMRRLLELDGHKYANGHHYGDGPNWRMRTIREALNRVGIPSELLNHGIAREVFAMPLAENWREYLQCHVDTPILDRPPAMAISQAALARWIVPRSKRVATWQDWDASARSEIFAPVSDTPVLWGQ